MSTATHVETGKDRIQAYLRDNGVSFTLRHHPRAVTAQDVAACEHIPGHLVAKPVLAVADGQTVLLVLPASHLVQMSKLAAALGASHVELASEDELACIFFDCEVGALPPFGNLYGLPVYVDRTIAEDDHIEFRAGTHTDTIGIAYADFERLAQPQLIDMARHH